MANGDDLRFTAAGASTEQESPVVPPPPPREIPIANIPPPRFNLTEENQALLNSIRSATTLTPQEMDTCKQSLFNLMTSNQEDAGEDQCSEVVSRFNGDGSDLRSMALLLTSDPDRFLEIARNNNGSDRIQELLGVRDDVDKFFFDAISHRFVHVMTDYEASRVGMQGMHVFSQERSNAMIQNVLRHAVRLARDRCGNVVLQRIIPGLGVKDGLFDIIAENALHLSYHVHGNYVVQRVLELNDSRFTSKVAVRLSDRCFGLSFAKSGSYVVQKFLDTEEGAVSVVGELLWGCDGESLARLATSEFGNYVVVKALRVMRERNMGDLFRLLVDKLRPFLPLLHGRNVGAFLDSLR